MSRQCLRRKAFMVSRAICESRLADAALSGACGAGALAFLRVRRCAFVPRSRLERSQPVLHRPEHPSYELAVAEHRWVVPEHFNIAVDVCDRHPREKLAMIHEHFSGALREVTWGELQDLSNQFANRSEERRVGKECRS